MLRASSAPAPQSGDPRVDGPASTPPLAPEYRTRKLLCYFGPVLSRRDRTELGGWHGARGGVPVRAGSVPARAGGTRGGRVCGAAGESGDGGGALGGGDRAASACGDEPARGRVSGAGGLSGDRGVGRARVDVHDAG